MQDYNFKSEKPTVETAVTQLVRTKFVIKQMMAAPLLCLVSFAFAIIGAICDIASVGLVVPLLDSLRDSSSSSTLLNKVGLDSVALFFDGMTPITKVRHVMILLFLIQLLKGVLSYLTLITIIRFQIIIEKNVRKTVFDKLMLNSLEKINSNSIATHFTLLNNYTGETAVFAKDILNFLPSIPTLFLYMAAMLAISWELTIGGVTLAILTSLLVGLLNKRLREIGGAYNRAAVKLNQIGFESLSSIRIIRLFNKQTFATSKFNSSVEDLQIQRYKRGNIQALIQPLYTILMTLTLTLLFLGATFITTDLNTEWIEATLVNLLLLSRLKGPVGTITNTRAHLSSLTPSLDNIIIFFQSRDSRKQKEGNLEFENLKHKIIIDNISYQYPDTEIDVLKNLSFEIPKGKMTAIVGASGSGKSTLIDVITRLYDPTKGSIKIDGVNLTDFTTSSWHKKIGVVSQNPFLFNDTISSNIRFGKLEATDEEIVFASKQAHADTFIREMPETYSTLVGDRGQRLSGGEAQRIAIARAIITKPEILVLDEATSSLDAESETLVQKAIDNIGQNRTVISIAHRLSTIRRADNIIVLEHGQIVETGTYNDLMDSKGYFYNYAELQKLN